MSWESPRVARRWVSGVDWARWAAAVSPMMLPPVSSMFMRRPVATQKSRMHRAFVRPPTRPILRPMASHAPSVARAAGRRMLDGLVEDDGVGGRAADGQALLVSLAGLLVIGWVLACAAHDLDGLVGQPGPVRVVGHALTRPAGSRESLGCARYPSPRPHPPCTSGCGCPWPAPPRLRPPSPRACRWESSCTG